jgi:hypothetical protein
MTTIPVIVDDPADEVPSDPSRTSAIRDLVRCVYFAIDAIKPTDNWTLNVTGNPIPFVLVHLSGIICRPIITDSTTTDEFGSADQIETTFSALEADDKLFVRTGRVYLPKSFVFSSTKARELAASDVLRLRLDVFDAAFSFANDRTSAATFQDQLKAFISPPVSDKVSSVEPIRVSSRETVAFSKWSKSRLNEAHDQMVTWRTLMLLEDAAGDVPREF